MQLYRLEIRQTYTVLAADHAEAEATACRTPKPATTKPLPT